MDSKKAMLLKVLANRKGFKEEEELEIPDELKDELEEQEPSAGMKNQAPSGMKIVDSMEPDSTEMDMDMIKAMLGEMSEEQAQGMDPKSLHQMAIKEMLKKKKV